MRREDLIVPLIAGRRVLDIGSLGQSEVYCLWHTLAQHSAQLTGVDLADAAATALGVIGVRSSALAHQTDARIRFGNMETMNLGQRFEVVTAGDVIEHVSNPGLFLDNIRRHLEPDGRLVLTTPNAKWPTVFLRPNPTHVLWHDAFTLRQLLERHGFRVERMRYYHGNKPDYAWWAKPLILRQQIFVVAVPA